jgi:serine/threonine-protein kinase
MRRDLPRRTAASNNAPLAPGDSVGDRYDLVREVSRSAGAVVFEAVHRTTRRRVAIKVVPTDAPPVVAAELRARLAREAHALAMVNHPSVIEVLDGGFGPHGPYLVTEMPSGRTLADLIAERSRLRCADAVSAGSKAASALEAVHRAGIVHRNVNPQSFVITRDGTGQEQLKLTSFGIAQVRGTGGSKITQIGAVVGSPAYTSPEQLLAFGDLDERADVYALGVTLFECMTGTVPFGGSYENILFAAVGDEPRPRLLALCPSAGEALADVVDRAISRDRDRRFQTMADFRRALHGASPWASTETTLLATSEVPADEWSVPPPPSAAADAR